MNLKSEHGCWRPKPRTYKQISGLLTRISICLLVSARNSRKAENVPTDYEMNTENALEVIFILTLLSLVHYLSNWYVSDEVAKDFGEFWIRELSTSVYKFRAYFIVPVMCVILSASNSGELFMREWDLIRNCKKSIISLREPSGSPHSLYQVDRDGFNFL